MQEEDISIPLADGHAIYGRLREIQDAPLVIQVHGFSANVMTDAMPYNLARHLNNAGYSSLRLNLYDYPDDARKLKHCTFAVHAADLDTVVRHLRANGFNNNIAIAGHSFGGLIATMLTEQVDALILIDPTTTEPAGLPSSFKRDGNRFFYDSRLTIEVSPEMAAEAQRLDAQELIARVRVPLTIIAADQARTPFVEQLFNAAPKPKHWGFVEGADHNFSRGDTQQALFAHIVSSLRYFGLETGVGTGQLALVRE